MIIFGYIHKKVIFINLCLDNLDHNCFNVSVCMSIKLRIDSTLLQKLEILVHV